jgi:tRNA modification GTPase
LQRAKESIDRAKDSLKDNKTSEFIVLDLRVALDSMGEIIGEVTTDEILESVFSKFCIGK